MFSCKSGVPCNQRDFVYQATCTKCKADKNGKKAEYVGVSGRPGGKKAWGAFEQSIKGKNIRTILGAHVIEKHRRIKDPKIDKIFNFKIIKNCKDTLAAFLAEDHYIKEIKPTLNSNFGNEFVF